MKILAIDRELEHYLRVISPNWCDDEKLFANWFNILVERYNLDQSEPDDNIIDEQLEAVLQAQVNSKVVYIVS